MFGKVLIIEEEELSSDVFSKTLRQVGLDVIGKAKSFLDGVIFAKKNRPDLVFLSVRKGNADEFFKIAEAFKETEIPWFLIINGLPMHEVDRFLDQIPIGVLNGHFSEDNLIVNLRLAFKKIRLSNEQSNFLFVKDGYQKVKINTARILFIKSDNHYLDIITLNSKHVVRMSLTQFSALLPSDSFVRVHKSYIVNSNRIFKIRANKLSVGDHEIPIGRAFKEKLTQLSVLEKDK